MAFSSENDVSSIKDVTLSYDNQSSSFDLYNLFFNKEVSEELR